MSDGPLGARAIKTIHHFPQRQNEQTGEWEDIPSVSMPAATVLCNSWNTELSYEVATVIAEDCIDRKIDLLLAPGVNIKRTPVCGRNFEYLSEDPFLAGKIAKAYIEGVQEKGVGTSLKHFCLNNAEYDRQAISAEVDERTMREIYLTAFEIALEAKPWTVMCSYNRILGIYASENPWILNEILRKEFGFDGLIVSDWGATHNAYLAAKATLDLTMPYHPKHSKLLKKAYEDGLITEEEIDERALKVLELTQKAEREKPASTLTREERHAVAVRAAEEGIVLLKNEENLLPFKGQKRLLVCGRFANQPPQGGGSSLVDMPPQTPLGELLQNATGAEVTYLPCQDRGALGSAILNAPAVYEAAYRADATIVCVGNTKLLEFEGGDREYLRLPTVEEELIQNLAKYTDNLIVIVYAGSAVDMQAWIDKAKAVVFASFAGEGCNEALSNLLTGKTNPSGKLSETFPLSINDTPTGAMNATNGIVDRYSEGVFVGYRHYDEGNKPVLFPFGYGLSYSKFVYSDLEVTKTGKLCYEVSFTVTNVSSVDGKEISQLYVRDVISSVSRPQKELKGFAKIFLKAGESKKITLPLNERSFAFYSVPLKKWAVENGDFEILVGGSSRDLPLKAKLFIGDADEQYSKP